MIDPVWRLDAGKEFVVCQRFATAAVLMNSSMDAVDCGNGLGVHAAGMAGASKGMTFPVKYAKRAAGVIEECRKAGHCLRPNPRHTSCNEQCRLWISPSCPACVCLDSMNVHLCGKDCTFPPRLSMDNDSHICPLTHIVLPDSAVMKTVPAFDNFGRPQTHWSAHKKINRRKVKKISGSAPLKARGFTPDAAEKVVQRVFNAGVEAQRLRNAKRMSVVALAARRMDAPSFFAISALVHSACNPPPPRKNVSAVLGSILSRYLSAHPAANLGNIDASVCTLLTLLSTGMTTTMVLWKRYPGLAHACHCRTK